MGTYKKTWACCGDTTETEAWIPSVCPFCSAHALRKALDSVSDACASGASPGYIQEIAEQCLRELPEGDENDQ
jgi:hypothetical protein